MNRIAVSDFRVNLGSFLKKVERGEMIVLTSEGQEIAKILPPDNKREQARESLKQLRKTAKVADVLSPIEEHWKVMT